MGRSHLNRVATLTEGVALLGPAFAALDRAGEKLSDKLAYVLNAPAAVSSIEGHLRRIATAAEALGELRADLAALPQTITALDGRIDNLQGVIATLMASVDELAAATHPLHAATQHLEALEHREGSGHRWLRSAHETTES